MDYPLLDVAPWQRYERDREVECDGLLCRVYGDEKHVGMLGTYSDLVSLYFGVCGPTRAKDKKGFVLYRDSVFPILVEPETTCSSLDYRNTAHVVPDTEIAG